MVRLQKTQSAKQTRALAKSSPKIFFPLISREWEGGRTEGRKKEKERNINARHTHRLVASPLEPVPWNLQQRCVLDQESNLRTFGCTWQVNYFYPHFQNHCGLLMYPFKPSFDVAKYLRNNRIHKIL